MSEFDKEWSQVDRDVYLDNLFSSSKKKTLQIPPEFQKTVMGKLAKRMAHCLEFPEGSALMALLGTASASVMSAYSVCYPSGDPIPTGLYMVIEQPPATQKTTVLEIGLKPYAKAIQEHNKLVAKRNALEENKELHLSKAFTVLTDATSAAMDSYIQSCSDGRFVVASAEQSAFASLFPENKQFASNNELVLKGYSGEYVGGARSTRKAYSGYVWGTVVLVAQPGSALRVFRASSGSGLAERFLYISEPSLLGKRTFHGEYLTEQDVEPFRRACTFCVQKYSSGELNSVIPTEVETLTRLKTTANGAAILLDVRRRTEPQLARLGESGDMLQLGWLGKIETHALKIAAVIHAIEYKASGAPVPDLIPDEYVIMAIKLVVALSQQLAGILDDAGESGESAEVEAVINAVGEKRRDLNSLCMLLKSRSPFRQKQGSWRASKARVQQMLGSGTLILNSKGEITL